MSAASANARPPARAISAAVCLAPLSSRSSAPPTARSSPSRSAIALAIPLAAPVTSTLRPTSPRKPGGTRAFYSQRGLKCAAMRRIPAFVLALFAVACSRPGPLDFSGPTADWPEYAGTKGGSHYSPLTQVTRANLGRLELAWSHHSGDFNPGSATEASTSFQVAPLVRNDTLYYCTPYISVFALDPETGAERWMFDPVLPSKSTGGA